MTIDDRIKNTMSAILGVPVSQITEDSSPDNLPQWDSINAINLCLGIEEEFETQLTDSEIAEMKTFALIKQTLISKGVE